MDGVLTAIDRVREDSDRDPDADTDADGGGPRSAEPEDER